MWFIITSKRNSFKKVQSWNVKAKKKQGNYYQIESKLLGNVLLEEDEDPVFLGTVMVCSPGNLRSRFTDLSYSQTV